MRIWVDADACPGPIKDILFRAATRWKLLVTLVANQALHVPPSPWIGALQVPRGADVADHEIAARVQAGDLVITADVPLAARVVERGARALDPRGELLDARNIGERLAMRDFMDRLREGGVATGGPAPFSQADRHAFARRLDALLMQRARAAAAAAAAAATATAVSGLAAPDGPDGPDGSDGPEAAAGAGGGSAGPAG